MTRRTIAVLVATFATSALAACAAPSTAPERSQLAPGASPRDATLCKGGTVSSEGRC